MHVYISLCNATCLSTLKRIVVNHLQASDPGMLMTGDLKQSRDCNQPAPTTTQGCAFG